MKFANKIATKFFMLLLIFHPISLHAESDVHVNVSDDLAENFMLMASFSAFLVISIPIYYLVYRPLEAASDKYHDSRATRLKAKNNVPDMEVKEIGEDEKGHPQVRLQDPHNPQNYVILIWPDSQNNPASGFQEGQHIRFQPSAQRSGWLLRDDNKTLAFIPVTDMQHENYSTLF